MKLKRTYSFGAGLGLLLVADLGAAAGIPAMHWGGMELQTSVSHCIGRARKAFHEAGVRNTQIGGWQAYGQKNTGAVLVSCAALSNNRSYLTVVGTSNDSREAELLRNDVRTRIARMREFDH
jgi:hypothetical protein